MGIDHTLRKRQEGQQLMDHVIAEHNWRVCWLPKEQTPTLTAALKLVLKKQVVAQGLADITALDHEFVCSIRYTMQRATQWHAGRDILPAKEARFRSFDAKRQSLWRDIVVTKKKASVVIASSSSATHCRADYGVSHCEQAVHIARRAAQRACKAGHEREKALLQYCLCLV
jgi:hypothetical protein